MIKKFGVTLITEKIEEVKAFYEKYFHARVHVDFGEYVILLFENQSDFELCLMNPCSQKVEVPLFTGGITLNLEFDDVEPIYQRCVENQALIFMPLEDHPWGDRGFSVKDPIGSIVYCYHAIPPAQDFKN